MLLAGRTAVITGGTRGLGRAIAERYLAEGANVVAAARNPHDFKEVLDEYPDRARFETVEVTSAESLRQLMATACRHFGTVDVVVANAGVSRDGRVHRLSEGDWHEMVDTNLTGTFLTTQAAVPVLEKQGGRIINVSSSMATRVAVGAAGYCATKAAIEMFTKVSAMELAPKGILVNGLAPGVIDEGMGRDLQTNKKVWEAYRTRFALGRLGRSEEVAAAAVFLAQDASSYVNGHVLEVNGGLLWA
ncbi:SDR family NAD(P)-dependent oxidoreductase [Streptomyces huasconensis]|uniref:SDR family NAD(P)-dependent oxidoreductase n=1 Tax=Streptomyces huasconensis TaxID=1854574 RepID=A0ABV3LN33_9ACTN